MSKTPLVKTIGRGAGTASRAEDHPTQTELIEKRAASWGAIVAARAPGMRAGQRPGGAGATGSPRRHGSRRACRPQPDRRWCVPPAAPGYRLQPDQPNRLAAVVEKSASPSGSAHLLVELAGHQLGIAAALATCWRQRASTACSATARLGSPSSAGQLPRAEWPHLDTQVDAVEQRSRTACSE